MAPNESALRYIPKALYNNKDEITTAFAFRRRADFWQKIRFGFK